MPPKPQISLGMLRRENGQAMLGRSAVHQFSGEADDGIVLLLLRRLAYARRHDLRLFPRQSTSCRCLGTEALVGNLACSVACYSHKAQLCSRSSWPQLPLSCWRLSLVGFDWLEGPSKASQVVTAP